VALPLSHGRNARPVRCTTPEGGRATQAGTKVTATSTPRTRSHSQARSHLASTLTPRKHAHTSGGLHGLHAHAKHNGPRTCSAWRRLGTNVAGTRHSLARRPRRSQACPVRAGRHPDGPCVPSCYKKSQAAPSLRRSTRRDATHMRVAPHVHNRASLNDDGTACKMRERPTTKVHLRSSHRCCAASPRSVVLAAAAAGTAPGAAPAVAVWSVSLLWGDVDAPASPGAF